MTNKRKKERRRRKKENSIRRNKCNNKNNNNIFPIIHLLQIEIEIPTSFITGSAQLAVSTYY